MATTLPASAASAVGAPTRATSLSMQAVCAMLLGALVIGVAGFSHTELVHNAAHDTRHSAGFPCH